MPNYSTDEIPINDEIFLRRNSHLRDEYFVPTVYETYLKIVKPPRKPLNLYIQQLQEESITREELLKLIRQLPEFKQLWRIDDSNREFRLTDAAFIEKTFVLKVEDFVAEAYRTYLKREPDGGRHNGYIKLIRENNLSRDQFLGAIRQSPEFNMLWRLAPVAVDDSVIDEVEEVQNITGDSNNKKSGEKESYSEKFTQEITGSLNFYIQKWEKIHPKKIKDEDFLAVTSVLEDTDFLQTVYRVYFKRDIDRNGLDVWLGHLINEKSKRGSVLRMLRMSQEYKNKWNSGLDNFINSLLQKLAKLKNCYFNVVLKFMGRM
ncbi:MAG: DUF4214 domain-containing protein [Cyanobacteria bacterium P01_H01_bin.35]